MGRRRNGDLFDGSNEWWKEPRHGGAARNADPDTSHYAAAMVDATRLEHICYSAVFREEPRGLTTWEIVYVTGIPFESVTPRMTTLEKKKLVYASDERRIPKGRKRPAIVWRINLAGPQIGLGEAPVEVKGDNAAPG